MAEGVWTRSDQWVGTEIEDNFVMINIDTGKYVALNSTANAVWAALETPQTQQEIEQALLDSFDVDAETCSQSVTNTLNTMSELQLASCE